MIVEQGDIVEISFDPTVGHEPRKRRPALVVSVGMFNNELSSLTVVCPITSTLNGHPLHVPLPPGSPAEGCVAVEQLRAVDLESPERQARHLGVMDEKTMSDVLETIGGVFGI